MAEPAAKSVPDPMGRLAALDGVGSAMAAARDGIDALVGRRGLRRTSPDLTAESLLRGAHASGALEGSPFSLEEIRGGGVEGAARSAVRLSAELLGLAPVLTRSPLQALARMHAVAATGTGPDDELGRPRGAGSAQRLAALGRLLTAPTAAPALVVAAVVHADIASTAPFHSCNGIVARAAERLVMVSRGVDPKSLIVPEAGHLAHRREYESSLRGYREGGATGVQSWLLYAARAFTAGIQASPLSG